jgi:hypothetical protein
VGRMHVEEPRSVFLREGGASIGVFPGRGWTLTVFVGDTARYEPASFLVIKRLDGALVGELLAPPPGEGEATHFRQLDLNGAALAAYLGRAQLDLAALDDVFAARWNPPGAGK